VRETIIKCEFCGKSAEEVEVRAPEGHVKADLCATHRKPLVDIIKTGRPAATGTPSRARRAVEKSMNPIIRI